MLSGTQEINSFAVGIIIKYKDMKNRIKLLTVMAGMVVFMAACQSGGPKKVENLAVNAHQVTAGEVIQTSRYTYVRVIEDDRDYWVAINKADITEGETYFWSVGMEMRNFTSTELKRTFESVFFVQDFTDQPITTDRPVPAPAMGGKQPVGEQGGINVERAEGGMRIGEIYARKSELAGKKVSIRGQVVKVSPGIMNRTWVHIQDGTKDGENFDLTVTTQEVVGVGDVVTFEGTVSVNKDFGAGYFYNVILEDATVKK
jgi:hypothetical protein